MTKPVRSQAKRGRRTRRPAPKVVHRALRDALLRLNATRDGFEGLIGDLLAAATDGGVRLMASGDQQGLDAIGPADGAPRRAMQAKRYGDTAKLDQTALLGEMARASAAIQGIDCWILATTKELMGKEREALGNHAETLGWGLIALDWSEAMPGLPRLATLCASHVEIAVARLGSCQPELEAIAADPGFAQAQAIVSRELTGADTGFAAAQRAGRAQLARIFEDGAAARTIAGKSPAFLAEAPPVPRSVLRTVGDAWWSGQQQVLVQLGLEGMGKTWGALDLLRTLSSGVGGPLSVVIDSRRANGSADGFEAVVDVLSEIGTHAGLRLQDPRRFWHRRLSLWLAAINGPRPQLLVLVDGLDELDPFDWRSWLAPLMTLERRRLFRIVLTCREDDWTHRLQLDDMLARDSVRASVGRFAPEERDAYLAARGIDPGDVSEQVREAALHPRTAFHLTRLAGELGDLKRITREQLLLRDFGNRHLLKGGALDANGFKALVSAQATAAQAAALQQQAFRITPGALLDAAADISGHDRDRMRSVLSDLVSAEWFERDPDQTHLLTFKDAALPDAVGFALADAVRRLPAHAALQEVDRFLEPWGADDLVEKVLRTLATALVVDRSVEDALCVAVLERWMEKPFHGSGGQDFWRRLHIFRPAIFLDLCARRAKFERSWLVEWGIASLWEDHEAARAEVEVRVGAWLSSVPLPEDHERGSAGYNRYVNRERRRQRRRLRALERLNPGVWTSRIGIPAADWPERATCTAARIVGFLPRLPFVPAIVRWAENQAAAGHVSREREIAASLRHNDIDHAVSLEAIRREAGRLIGLGPQTARKAAAHLLRATGEPGDAERADALSPSTVRFLGARVQRGVGTDHDLLSLRAHDDQPRDAFLIAALAEHATDPAATLDVDLAAALASAAARLPPEDFPELFEQNGGKLAVLLRWHPERVFTLHRAFLAQVSAHAASAPTFATVETASAVPTGAAADEVDVLGTHETFRRHALGALPFLTDKEAATLASAVEARAAPDGAGRGAANALRLARMPAADQIRLLTDALPDDWPSDFKYLLNKPVGTEIDDLIKGIEMAGPRDAIWPRLVLAREMVRRFRTNPDGIARGWSHGIDHPDDDVRQHVAEIARAVDGRAAATQMLAARGPGAITSDGKDTFERSALLLALDDETLRPLLGRLDLEVLTHAYLHRPALRADILIPWRAWMEDRLLVPRTSRSFGGSFVRFRDRDAAYAAYYAEDADAAVRLIRTAWEDKALRDNIIWEHGEGPAWPLVIALAPTEPGLVKDIWRGSLSTSGSGMWDGRIEEFPADLPPGGEFDDLRAEMLGRALTDEKLFGAVRTLEEGGHLDFLVGWIRMGLDAERALDRAKALTAAGFLDGTDAAVLLWADIDAKPMPAGWLGEVRRKARGWFGRVQAARHWYRLMSAADDEESAYRAFWLHTRSSDNRYPHYFRASGLKVEPSSWRAQWLDFTREVTKSMRTAAGADLKNSYVGDKRVHDIVHGR